MAERIKKTWEQANNTIPYTGSRTVPTFHSTSLLNSQIHECIRAISYTITVRILFVLNIAAVAKTKHKHRLKSGEKHGLINRYVGIYWNCWHRISYTIKKKKTFQSMAVWVAMVTKTHLSRCQCVGGYNVGQNSTICHQKIFRQI